MNTVDVVPLLSSGLWLALLENRQWRSLAV